jgi:hypothetical protein
LALLKWHEAQRALCRQAADDAMGLEEDNDQDYDDRDVRRQSSVM